MGWSGDGTNKIVGVGVNSILEWTCAAHGFAKNIADGLFLLPLFRTVEREIFDTPLLYISSKA